jgi:hypothetical protein
MAERVLAILRDAEPRARLAELAERVRSQDADEREAAILALATALLEQVRGRG